MEGTAEMQSVCALRLESDRIERHFCKHRVNCMEIAGWGDLDGEFFEKSVKKKNAASVLTEAVRPRPRTPMSVSFPKRVKIHKNLSIQENKEIVIKPTEKIRNISFGSITPKQKCIMNKLNKAKIHKMTEILKKKGQNTEISLYPSIRIKSISPLLHSGRKILSINRLREFTRSRIIGINNYKALYS